MTKQNHEKLARVAVQDSGLDRADASAHLKDDQNIEFQDVGATHSDAKSNGGRRSHFVLPRAKTWLVSRWRSLLCVAVLAACGLGAYALSMGSVVQVTEIGSLVFGIGLGVAVLAVWDRLSSRDRQGENLQASRGLESQPSLLDELDQKIEQVEDARWQLDERAQRYRDLLDQHQDMIVRLNSEGVVTFANRTFCQTFGVDMSELAGRPLREEIADVLPRQGSYAPSGVQTEANVSMATEHGLRWIAWHGQAIKTSDGLEHQYDGRDITDEVQTKHTLKAARDDAEQANQAKSRFLASMSHEIRTPMNGILGMARLLQNEPLSRQQTTYVDAIDLSARNLLTIIDEILDYSKIEAGRLILSDRQFSIEHLVLSVVELLAPGAHEKGLDLAWTVHPSAQGEFIGDPARVRQILLNLVSNAVKYTDKGGISVAVQRAPNDPPSTPGNPPIVIRVSDTGIGLSENEQRSLFSEFSQTDQAVKRQAGGTGLGLAISRRLAEAMDGSLTVESVVGVGSTFVATLNLPSTTPADQRAVPQTRLPEGTKVLLALDRDVERAAFAKILTFADADFMESRFSDAAQTIAESSKELQPINRLVVDDRSDPERAGQLLSELKATAKTLGHDPGMVRGLVMVDMLSRERLPAFENQGFDGYLVRPIRPLAVLEQLALTGTDTRASKTSSAPQTVQINRRDNRALRFMLVEDNDINALLVEKQLLQSGHTVVRDVSGAAVLSRVRRCLTGSEAPYDVILMDVLLPEMDGLEATRMIFKLYQTNVHTQKRPPIIALTANAFEEDRQRCLDAGMDDYLAKPFDQDMLNAVLDRCLSQETDAHSTP